MQNLTIHIRINIVIQDFDLLYKGDGTNLLKFYNVTNNSVVLNIPFLCFQDLVLNLKQTNKQTFNVVLDLWILLYIAYLCPVVHFLGSK